MVDRGRGGGEGVRTRDHLANVRTTLSWVRMGLVLMGIGYALDKVAAVEVVRGVGGALDRYGRSLGMLVLGAGMGLVLAALPRFLFARARIESATFEARPAADLVLVGAVAAGAVAILAVLVAGQ